MHNSDLVDIVTIPVRKCLGLSMDVYKPVGEFKEPLPIILDVHGGGLIAGRKEQNRNLGIQLARRGYIVFIPDYRLVPETDIFGQISDILDALAVIEAKAAEFGGNVEKLFVTADSAGAFLASMAVASLHHPAEMQPVIRRLERYIPQKVQALRVTAMGFQSGMFYLYKGQVGLLANNYMQKGWRKEKYASYIRPEYYCKLLPPCFLCSGKGDFLKGQTKHYVKLLKTNTSTINSYLQCKRSLPRFCRTSSGNGDGGRWQTMRCWRSFTAAHDKLRRNHGTPKNYRLCEETGSSNHQRPR